MNSWKERIAGKLSLLLGDTPSDLSGESSIVPPDTQARPLPKEGGLGFRRSLSSLFSSILPTASIDGYNRSNKHGCDIKPIQPLPTKWRCKNFPLDDEPPQDWDLEFVPVWEEDETHVAEDGPDNLENATISHIWVKIVPNLTDKSSFISSDLYEFLQPSLPNIVKGCQWALLYSTWKHGISLRTLLRKSFDLSGPCLLIVGDMRGAVFGGLLECPLRPTSTRKYQGTNQTFVFTTTYGEPRLFKATGANRYFYVCMNDLLALGGGCNFALCLDGDLLCGTSGPCETFGNLCLAHSQEFELKNVELWGFTHSSQYLT